MRRRRVATGTAGCGPRARPLSIGFLTQEACARFAGDDPLNRRVVEQMLSVATPVWPKPGAAGRTFAPGARARVQSAVRGPDAGLDAGGPPRSPSVRARNDPSAVKSSCIAQSTAACAGPAFGGGPARRQPVPPQGGAERAWHLQARRTMNTRRNATWTFAAWTQTVAAASVREGLAHVTLGRTLADCQPNAAAPWHWQMVLRWVARGAGSHHDFGRTVQLVAGSERATRLRRVVRRTESPLSQQPRDISGIRITGAADDHRVPGTALWRGRVDRVRLRLRTGHDEAASVATGTAAPGRDH